MTHSKKKCTGQSQRCDVSTQRPIYNRCGCVYWKFCLPLFQTHSVSSISFILINCPTVQHYELSSLFLIYMYLQESEGEIHQDIQEPFRSIRRIFISVFDPLCGISCSGKQPVCLHEHGGNTKVALKLLTYSCVQHKTRALFSCTQMDFILTFIVHFQL